MLKKILFALILVAGATVTHAESDLKTAASKAYVDTSVETLQDKIPAANTPGVGAGETVMTYTAAGNGAIGERGIYTGANAYNANSDADKLITASALNDTFTNLPTTGTTKLECANLNDGCTLWTIVDQTAYTFQLPDGYTQLEYINIPAGSYILTGVIPTYSGRYEMDIQTTSIISGATTYLGVRPSNTGNGGLRFAHITSGVFRVYGFGAYKDSVDTISASTRYKFVWDNRHATIISGGTTVFDETYTGTDACLYPLAINGWNNAGVITAGLEGIYVYSFKSWNAQGEMVANFIPAKNNSNVVGMYDLVSGTFFTNAGTGDFIDGPAVN